MCSWDDAEVANYFSCKGMLISRFSVEQGAVKTCWESRAQHFELELPGGMYYKNATLD